MSNRYNDRRDEWGRDRTYGAANRGRYASRDEERDLSRRTSEYEPFEGARRYVRDYGETGRRSTFEHGGYVGPFGGYESQVSADRDEWNRGYRGRDVRDYRGRDYRDEEHRGLMDRIADTVASWFGDEDAARRHRADQARAHGQHRGRGPKGYRRSDERIREDVSDRLADHPYLDASEIEVVVTEGVVTLSGTVEDRASKRLAEDVAEEASGVNDVQNQLRVDRPSFGSQAPAKSASTATPPDKSIQH